MRVTTTVARVLRVFLDDPTTPRYGLELMKTTGFPSGTLYPEDFPEPIPVGSKLRSWM